MSAAQRWLLWSTTLLGTASGLAYVWMRELLEGEDPFSAYNHPLQPIVLAVHVALAPPLVFAVGWIFAPHVLARLRDSPARRGSGVTLLVLFAAMVASGTALQLSGAPAARLALAWTHGVTGTLWAVVFVAHGWSGWRLRRARTR